jgi:hypothetical protein
MPKKRTGKNILEFLVFLGVGTIKEDCIQFKGIPLHTQIPHYP